MMNYLWVLVLASMTAGSEPLVIPFTMPENFPLIVRLSLPESDSVVISHEKKDHSDTIVARINDDRKGGMVVEAVDATGKRMWHHDFGYNLSASPGCSVSVSAHSQVKALIVSFHGYEWNKQNKLPRPRRSAAV